MDIADTRAQFARNVAEAHRILTEMRAEVRANNRAIEQTRETLQQLSVARDDGLGEIERGRL